MAEWSCLPALRLFRRHSVARQAHRKGLYQCNEPECREQFSVTVGTVFERSKIPLHKWVLAAHLIAASKKGMSSKQLERMLGVTYKTAWFMTMRLREAMRDKDAVAHRRRGQGRRERRDFRRRQEEERPQVGKPEPKKHAVHALVERGGEVRAKHVADVTAKTLREAIVTQAQPQVGDCTPTKALTYYHLGKEFAKHRTVNHSQDEYFKDGAGVQSAESFFALLKRGVYRHVPFDQRAAPAALLRRVRLPLEQPISAWRRRLRARRPAAQGRQRQAFDLSAD